MPDAFRNCGCAISTTTAVTTQTNRPTCVDNVIVQPVGNVARVNRITVAFRNGCSATEKMIAVITVTNCRKTVPFVMAKPISSVPTIAVFQSK